MDTTGDKAVFFLEQFWSFLAVALGVALGGIAAKRLVAVIVPAEKIVADAEGRTGPYRTSAAEIAIDPKLPLWYRIWRATISTHPVIVGGLAGLTPIPVSQWVPDSTAAHMLWFALAGALSGQIFEIGKRLTEIIPAVIRQRLGGKSEPPPPPPSPATASLADSLEPEDRERDETPVPKK
jgi:hypothetical protein